MKISVLIAAYCAERTLGATLESVRAQRHADWELLVVEDGSRDATEAIVRRFAESCHQPVRYENLGVNRGVSAARNRLMSLATGEAIAFLDADDLWRPEHLAAAAARLDEGADLVVSGVETFELATGTVLAALPPDPALTTDPVSLLFQRSAIVTSSCVTLRRRLALTVGSFDASLRVGEDRDYWLRCALAGGRFAWTPDLTCRYAKHPGSTMARTLLVAEQSVRFYEKYRLLNSVPARLRRLKLADSLVSLGRLVRAVDARRSATSFYRAWRCSPFNPAIPLHLLLSTWRAARTSRAG